MSLFCVLIPLFQEYVLTSRLWLFSSLFYFFLSHPYQNLKSCQDSFRLNWGLSLSQTNKQKVKRYPEIMGLWVEIKIWY